MEPSSSTAAISLCQLSIATAVIRQGSLSFSCQKLRSCRIRQSSISSSCQKATDVIRQSQLSLSAVIWRTAVTSQGQLLSSSCQKATAVIRRGKLFSFSFKRPQLSSVKANCLFKLLIGYNSHDQLFAFSCHSCRQSRPAAYF